MATEKKEKIVQALQETFSRCSIGIMTDYRGLPTAELNALRRKLREANEKSLSALPKDQTK